MIILLLYIYFIVKVAGPLLSRVT